MTHFLIIFSNYQATWIQNNTILFCNLYTVPEYICIQYLNTSVFSVSVKVTICFFFSLGTKLNVFAEGLTKYSVLQSITGSQRAVEKYTFTHKDTVFLSHWLYGWNILICMLMTTISSRSRSHLDFNWTQDNLNEQTFLNKIKSHSIKRPKELVHLRLYVCMFVNCSCVNLFVCKIVCCVHTQSGPELQTSWSTHWTPATLTLSGSKSLTLEMPAGW